jgi:Uma2 family endonuclease
METITRRKMSIDDYHRMFEVGIIGPDERVELINGEIIEMSPIGDRHLGIVSRINMLLAPRLAGKYIVHVQSPIKLNDNSEPEPDLIVTPHRDDYYTTTGIYPKDILLLIEVSDTTLQRDVELKLPLYAQAGIQEVWIIDLQHDEIGQFASPSNGSYEQKIYKREDQFSATHLPLEVKGKDIIG